MSASAPPDSVIVARAPSGEIMFSNRYAERVVGRRLADIADDFPMFHLDGRPYALPERQLLRSLAGEEIVDEEFLSSGANEGGVRYRVSCWPVCDDDGQIVAAVAVTRDVTEEKRREERLTYLAGLLDHTEDAVVALNAQWFLTVWNAGAERMYGWTADEVLGRHTLDVARLEMSYEQRAAVRLAAAKHGVWRGEVIAYRKDGAPVWVELITVALKDTAGDITGYLGIHRDISERKQAEEALLESQRRIETTLESITDAFVALDRDWRYTYVNERALRRMEWRSGKALTPQDVLGRGIWELFPDGLGTTFEEKYREAMRERRVVQFETYFAPSDEWIEAHAYPSEEGLSIYYRDISDRKRAEQERESKVQQQALVAELGRRALATDHVEDLLDEAVVLVAQTLDVKFAGVAQETPGGETLTLRAGVGSSAPIVGQQLARDSLAGYTLSCRAPVIVDDMATDARFDGEMARAYGVVSALSVMIESPDEPFGVLSVLSTKRRRFSESDVSFVQAVANVLAGAVERRRAERRLDEVREAERRRIARNLHDEALQDLTEAVIQAGSGRTAGLDGVAAGALVSTLERVSRQLRSAIYDLRLSGDEVTRPFGERLHDLVDIHRTLAVDSGISLEVAGETAASSLGDRGTDVLRVVGEALTNARRHSGAGSIRVSASGSDEHLQVEVSDDGRGFHAHEPSWVDGMGIAGMRERAALLEADLDITSTAATGTTVRLQLGPPKDERRTNVTRILLVEDHTAVRQALAGMFEREPDLDVVGQAGSLAEARSMLGDVDVAVIDLGLPDGYGGDLIRELRDANPLAHTVVLSASLDPAEIARAMDSGAGSAVDKTAALDQLVGAVRRLHSTGA